MCSDVQNAGGVTGRSTASFRNTFRPHRLEKRPLGLELLGVDLVVAVEPPELGNVVGRLDCPLTLTAPEIDLCCDRDSVSKIPPKIAERLERVERLPFGELVRRDSQLQLANRDPEFERE